MFVYWQNFDLTAKKKKKTKKFEFNDEEDSGKNVDDGAANGDDGEPADDLDDLGDFSGLKKKKKKKKPFNLDDLEGALPTEGKDGSEKASPSDERANDSQAAEAAVDDLDFDFTAKKKKKKKKTTFDLPDQDEAADKENEGELDDEFKEEGAASSGQSKWLDTDRDYTYDELLEIIYNKIKEKNPESESGTKKKLVMRPPQVLRVGTKKTSFANFLEICKSYVYLVDAFLSWFTHLCLPFPHTVSIASQNTCKPSYLLN